MCISPAVKSMSPRGCILQKETKSPGYLFGLPFKCWRITFALSQASLFTRISGLIPGSSRALAKGFLYILEWPFCGSLLAKNVAEGSPLGNGFLLNCICFLQHRMQGWIILHERSGEILLDRMCYLLHPSPK